MDVDPRAHVIDVVIDEYRRQKAQADRALAQTAAGRGQQGNRHGLS